MSFYPMLRKSKLYNWFGTNFLTSIDSCAKDAICSIPIKHDWVMFSIVGTYWIQDGWKKGYDCWILFRLLRASIPTKFPILKLGNCFYNFTNFFLIVVSWQRVHTFCKSMNKHMVTSFASMSSYIEQLKWKCLSLLFLESHLNTFAQIIFIHILFSLNHKRI